ncbi:hypothetical protein BH09BAC4_BH09BAC4_19200 [soil metagenome]
MRYVFLLYLHLSLLSLVLAQPLTIAQANRLRRLLKNSRPDTLHIHTRLRLGIFYLHKTLDANSSLDSALIMAHQAKILSHQLSYTKGFEDAVFLQGSVYVYQHKTALVEQMLTSISDTNQIRLLLELGKSWLRSTLARDADCRRARAYFRRAEAESNRIHNQRWQQESQQLLGMSYVLMSDWSSSKAYFLPVIQTRQQLGDREGELWVWIRWLSASYCEDCQEQIALTSQVLRRARHQGKVPEQLFLLTLIGYYYVMMGNSKQAQWWANQAVTLYKTIGPSATQQTYARLVAKNDFMPRSNLIDLATPYLLLADINTQNNSLDQALGNYLKLIDDIQRIGVGTNLDYLYFLVGNVYYDWNQYDKSIEYYQRSLAISHQQGEVVIHVGMTRRLVASLLQLNKPQSALTLLKHIVAQGPPLNDNKTSLYRSFGDCYMALKQYSLAERYYLQALRCSTLEPYSWGRNIVWLQLSQFYVTTNQFARANHYLERLLNHPVPVYPIRDKLQTVWLQFKVDSAYGHQTSALQYYQRYKAINDSIFNQAKSQQIAELGIRYEMQNKERDQLLKVNRIRLFTQQNYAQQTQRNSLLAGAALLLGLLGLGYSCYRMKHSHNRLLQAQQEQIGQKSQDLQRLMEEKERLLKEIHHRVKNNLQIVMSLLNSQAASLTDQAALSAIKESQHRVQAMALIHQKLYHNEGIARIPMEAYILELITYLNESFALPQPIRFELVIDPIELDVTQAVPLGLIINEAITNALKYAFPAGREGKVLVKLSSIREGLYELVITHDGIGLPADFDPTQSRSLGMTLLHGFSEQLGGRLQISGQLGLHVRLLFHDETDLVNI